MNIVLLPLKSLMIGTPPLWNIGFGQSDIGEIRQSLIKDGLLNPLRVTFHKGKYKVTDGKKRLKALKSLAKTPLFTRSLYKIPCVLEEDMKVEASQANKTDSFGSPRRRPALLSEPELVHAILKYTRNGLSDAHIAKRLRCDIAIVHDAKTLPLLHAKVLKRFNDKTINLNQAAAFATIPNKTAQWNLLMQLGPFVSDTDIIMAIKQGETVLELPDENILIVPSRNPVPYAASRTYIRTARARASQKTVEALTHRLAA